MAFRLLGAFSFLAALALGAAAPAGAAMHSTKLAPGLCETSGGGRFVAVPGFPGERIDRRLLTDIRWLERRFPIYITDGYSRDDVHAAGGEHPIGLALDIVPDKTAGGRWSDIDRLARWAEPRQDHPRQPFRWVGYDGDAGHGRGNHLHLSWGHSVAKNRPGHPVRTVYTIRCPRGVTPAPPPAPPAPTPPTPPPPPTPAPESNPPVGGVKAGGGRGGSGSGGVGAKPWRRPPVVESGGVGIRD
ncbi:MAG: hypothetical protein GEU88_04905 [Solirubrobacterales bacterium]|nr:hypothetical protein [Solirubrobacterales bacterium]